MWELPVVLDAVREEQGLRCSSVVEHAQGHEFNPQHIEEEDEAAEAEEQPIKC